VLSGDHVAPGPSRRAQSREREGGGGVTPWRRGTGEGGPTRPRICAGRDGALVGNWFPDEFEPEPPPD
jgi:hypothetical protein